MKFRPLHDRIVVRRITAEEKSAGGIIIPDTAKEKPMEGEVIAVGPGARNEQGALVELDVKAGDRVFWLKAGFSRWGDNTTEVTATVMKALVAHDPADPLIPGVLAYFHSTKRGDRWDSTKDTASVLYALCDYLAAVRAGQAAAGVVKVALNGAAAGEVKLDGIACTPGVAAAAIAGDAEASAIGAAANSSASLAPRNRVRRVTEFLVS